MEIVRNLLCKSYFILLKCYPRSYVDTFGDEMAITFQRLLDEAIDEGWWFLLLFVVREFRGLLHELVREVVVTSWLSQRIRLFAWACLISLLIPIGTTVRSWFVVPPERAVMDILAMASGISIIGLLYLSLYFRYGTVRAVLAVAIFGMSMMSAVLQAFWLAYLIPLIALFGLLLYQKFYMQYHHSG